MANILIAGCGYVGSALAERLTQEGHQVYALRRRAKAPPPGVEGIQADLTRPETLAALPARLEFVFYTAGAAAFTEQAYRAAYVDGLRHLCDALGARQQPPKRIFFTSSTGVYHQRAGEAVDESSPTLPMDPFLYWLVGGQKSPLWVKSGLFPRSGPSMSLRDI